MGPFMVEIVFCRVTRRGRKKGKGMNKLAKENCRNDGPAFSFIPPEDTIKITLDLSDNGPVFSALDSMMMKMMDDDAKDRKKGSASGDEAKKSLKRLMKSGIPGVEKLFTGPQQAGAPGMKKKSKGFHSMNDSSKQKFMNAVFGEDGTSIDAGTAAALLAATCSGGDPEIGNNIAEMLLPEMGDKVDPAMMAALMSSCSLINCGGTTEEVMKIMKAELANSGLSEEEILRRTTLLMKAFGRCDPTATMAEYALASKQRNTALRKNNTSPKDFTIAVLVMKAIAACGSTPENVAKIIMIENQLSKKGAQSRFIADALKHLGDFDAKRDEVIASITNAFSEEKLKRDDVFLNVRMTQAIDNENEPTWKEVKNMKDILAGCSPTSPEGIELNLARATKSGGLGKNDIAAVLIAQKAMAALGADPKSLAQIINIQKLVAENGVPPAEIARVMSDGVMPIDLTEFLAKQVIEALPKDLTAQDVDCFVNLYDNLRLKSNIPLEVIEHIDNTLIQVRCSLEDVADNLVCSQLARGEKESMVIRALCETLIKTGSSPESVATTMMAALRRVLTKEECDIMKDIGRTMHEQGTEKNALQKSMVELLMNLLDENPDSYEIRMEALKTLELVLKEAGGFPNEIRDFIGTLELPPEPPDPKVLAEIARKQAEEEEREAERLRKEAEAAEAAERAKNPVVEEVVESMGGSRRGSGTSVTLGGVERRGSFYSEDVTKKATVAMVVDEPINDNKPSIFDEADLQNGSQENKRETKLDTLATCNTKHFEAVAASEKSYTDTSAKKAKGNEGAAGKAIRALDRTNPEESPNFDLIDANGAKTSVKESMSVSQRESCVEEKQRVQGIARNNVDEGSNTNVVQFQKTDISCPIRIENESQQKDEMKNPITARVKNEGPKARSSESSKNFHSGSHHDEGKSEPLSHKIQAENYTNTTIKTLKDEPTNLLEDNNTTAYALPISASTKGIPSNQQQQLKSQGIQISHSNKSDDNSQEMALSQTSTSIISNIDEQINEILMGTSKEHSKILQQSANTPQNILDFSGELTLHSDTETGTTQIITVTDPITGQPKQQIIQTIIDPKTGKSSQRVVSNSNATNIQVITVEDPVTGKLVQQMVQTVIDPKSGKPRQIPVDPKAAGANVQMITIQDPKTGKLIQQMVQTVIDPKSGKPKQIPIDPAMVAGANSQMITIQDPVTGKSMMVPAATMMVNPGKSGAQQPQIITVPDPVTGQLVQQVVQTVIDPVTGQARQVMTPLTNYNTQNGLGTHGQVIQTVVDPVTGETRQVMTPSPFFAQTEAGGSISNQQLYNGRAPSDVLDSILSMALDEGDMGVVAALLKIIEDATPHLAGPDLNETLKAIRSGKVTDEDVNKLMSVFCTSGVVSSAGGVTRLRKISDIRNTLMATDRAFGDAIDDAHNREAPQISAENGQLLDDMLQRSADNQHELSDRVKALMANSAQKGVRIQRRDHTEQVDFTSAGEDMGQGPQQRYQPRRKAKSEMHGPVPLHQANSEELEIRAAAAGIRIQRRSVKRTSLARLARKTSEFSGLRNPQGLANGDAEDEFDDGSDHRKIIGLKRSKVPMMVYSHGGFSRCFRIARRYHVDGPPVGVEYEEVEDTRTALNPELQNA